MGHGPVGTHTPRSMQRDYPGSEGHTGWEGHPPREALRTRLDTCGHAPNLQARAWEQPGNLLPRRRLWHLGPSKGNWKTLEKPFGALQGHMGASEEPPGALRGCWGFGGAAVDKGHLLPGLGARQAKTDLRHRSRRSPSVLSRNGVCLDLRGNESPELSAFRYLVLHAPGKRQHWPSRRPGGRESGAGVWTPEAWVLGTAAPAPRDQPHNNTTSATKKRGFGRLRSSGCRNFKNHRAASAPHTCVRTVSFPRPTRPRPAHAQYQNPTPAQAPPPFRAAEAGSSALCQAHAHPRTACRDL